MTASLTNRTLVYLTWLTERHVRVRGESWSGKETDVETCKAGSQLWNNWTLIESASVLAGDQARERAKTV
jgi:hypothetical protein